MKTKTKQKHIPTIAMKKTTSHWETRIINRINKLIMIKLICCKIMDIYLSMSIL